MARKKTASAKSTLPPEEILDAINHLSAEDRKALVEKLPEFQEAIQTRQMLREILLNVGISLSKTKRKLRRHKPDLERLLRGEIIHQLKERHSWGQMPRVVKREHPEWLSEYDLQDESGRKLAKSYLRRLERDYLHQVQVLSEIPVEYRTPCAD
jgi:hypothetical protein